MVNLIQKSKEKNDDDLDVSEPLPHVCTKIYQLLETELEYLQKNWYKRILFSFYVPCPCEKPCDTHGFTHCMEDECLHLLPLKQCLSKKIVECDYRQVKTDFIQKYFCGSSYKDFPESNALSPFASGGHSSNLATPVISRSFWGDHDVSGDDVQWFRGAGKMLNSGQAGRDWIALAKRLGYSEREITNFEDDIHPALTLLNNWLESNGRTRYCIDLLISCLEQMERQDVAERIQTEIGPELPAPPVFISYQWDSQESVLHLRRRLEFAGFPCWMDVGQLGGGDTLYGRIYEGISKAKVFLCCLTPRYALSPTCSREASLADVLRKPIVPVMMEPTPWPPPGPLAIILSSLVYIDLCSIGGHGGCGRQADWESKFQNIMERLAHYISPAFAGYHLNETSAGRLIGPPDTLCKNHSDFTDTAANSDDRGSTEAIAPGEEDSSSVSTRGQRSNTPIAWERSHSINRVVRCSICIVI